MVRILPQAYINYVNISEQQFRPDTISLLIDEVLLNVCVPVCVCVCVSYLTNNFLWNFIRHRSRYETRKHTITPNPKPEGKEKEVLHFLFQIL